MLVNLVCLLVNWCVNWYICIQREVRLIFFIIMEFLKQFEFSILEDDESFFGEIFSLFIGLVFEVILQRLFICVNKEFIDEVQYCSFFVIVFLQCKFIFNGMIQV